MADTFSEVTRQGYGSRLRTFSIMAVQTSSGGFSSFEASNGEEKFLVESGVKSSAALLTSAREKQQAR